MYTKRHGQILATMLGWSLLSVVIAGLGLVWKKEDQEYGLSQAAKAGVGLLVGTGNS